MLHPFTRATPGQRRHVLARLQPHLRPRETRPQRLQQPRPFPQRRPRAYPDGSSRLRFCCQHKHMDRQAAASYARPHQANTSPQVRTPSAAAVLGAGGERVRLASERGELLAEVGEVDAFDVGAAD